MMGKDEAAPPLMTVRQLARQGDVTVHVVRNYLRRGLLQAATHTEGGYRVHPRFHGHLREGRSRP